MVIRKLLSKWRYAKINSALIRRLLGLYYTEGEVYRIPFGPLRGMKMRYDRSVNFHAVLGLWELHDFRLLSNVLLKSGWLKDDMVICDVGANIGMYSLWFSRLLSPQGVVYAFEPSPYAATRLRENLALNDNTRNVEILEIACSNQAGRVEFFIGHHHHTSSLIAEWAAAGHTDPNRIEVTATTLDDFFYRAEPRTGPDLIKMDIEGGATLALKGCQQCIQEKRPLFLVESHMPAEDRAVSDVLVNHDYRAYRVDNWEWVEVLTDTFPNPKGVWGTLFLCPVELSARFAEHLA